ncbi:RNA-directed DNA polymerase from mobile element jockey-like [Rhizophagus irregularis DAOM 181602=DAOM 197198]|nr:RNA-directed DNA polymerase from mobile element jockey-like [Rhizophagus irregularis DAOM 181602=DAOM 197198]
MAMNRRHKVEKVINYSKITDDQWKTFTEQSELILEEELKMLKIEECPTTTTLNRIWNSIKQIINKAKNIYQRRNRIRIKIIYQKLELQDNKKHMLDSILNRKRKKIVLDKVLIKKDGQKQLCSTEKEITEAMIEHYQNAAGKKMNDGIAMSDRWQRQYAPKNDINTDWYNATVKEITEEEWMDTIQELTKDKAAGPSKVSNEELKHLGTNMKALTLKLANMCLQIGDIPGEWREALFCNCGKKYTKGGNHAALPGRSTETSLRIINTCIEDAKVNKKHIWLIFQDLSKAYDRVDVEMLKLAIDRIKIPKILIQLITNLFVNSKKAIIGYNGVTPQFTSQIGIDQGEVISPLLWTIYYDPLLTEIDSLRLGYKIEHSWKTNIQVPHKKSLSAIVSSQTYMDDVTWLTGSKYMLEKILDIANEFNKMNNIQINYEKFAMTTNEEIQTIDGEIDINFGSEIRKIKPIKAGESVRILGVWVNLDLNTKFVLNQCKDIIRNYNRIIRKKRVTDLQMKYIYNHVIIPRIEYKSQLTIWNHNQIEQLNKLCRSMFKQKTSLVATIPNSVIHSSLGYGVKDIGTIQLQRQVTRLYNQFNTQGVLGQI